MKEKTLAEKLRDELTYNPKNGGAVLNEDQLRRAFEFCDDYKEFLDSAKTEREAVTEAVRLAEIAGFVPFEKGKVYQAGEKVYRVNRGKAVMLAVIGSKPISEGVRFAIAHIDSPRLDLKPNPLYEADELAMFKTHYYGGIKKYQWTTVPLAMHGVICLADGSRLEVRIGEEEGDPQFCVTDLLPHLGYEQEKKPLGTAIPGENLNILVGSLPIGDEKGSDLVKLNTLKLLHEKYGLVEADFLSAEIEFVPAAKARDVGFDRSMIGAYGHDDRVCAYPALMAALTCNNPAHTAVAVLYGLHQERQRFRIQASWRQERRRSVRARGQRAGSSERYQNPSRQQCRQGRRRHSLCHLRRYPQVRENGQRPQEGFRLSRRAVIQ